MQSNRQVQPPKGVLDKKWVTCVLALLLIALIAVFAASLRYQDEVINFFKNLFRFGQEEKPQRPTTGKVGKRESEKAGKQVAEASDLGKRGNFSFLPPSAFQGMLKDVT